MGRAALGGDDTLRGVPFDYAMEQLAARWGIPPWEVEDAPLEWLVRSFEYRRIEGSVKRG